MAEKLENLGFEEALEQLEECSEKLRSGELRLEESTEVYRKSILLYNRCTALLNEARQKIEAFNPETGEITEF